MDRAGVPYKARRHDGAPYTAALLQAWLQAWPMEIETRSFQMQINLSQIIV
jgi:hypothetical protein